MVICVSSEQPDRGQQERAVGLAGALTMHVTLQCAHRSCSIPASSSITTERRRSNSSRSIIEMVPSATGRRWCSLTCAQWSVPTVRTVEAICQARRVRPIAHRQYARTHKLVLLAVRFLRQPAAPPPRHVPAQKFLSVSHLSSLLVGTMPYRKVRITRRLQSECTGGHKKLMPRSLLQNREDRGITGRKSLVQAD